MPVQTAASLLARLDQERETTATVRRRLARAKGEVTRVKKRADAGVCRHCHRTFQNVARHRDSA